jgi:hypothetical protein
MLNRRRMIVPVIVMLGEVDVRRRQHRGKHHGRNEQRRGGGPPDSVGNHARIILRLPVQSKDIGENASQRSRSEFENSSATKPETLAVIDIPPILDRGTENRLNLQLRADVTYDCRTDECSMPTAQQYRRNAYEAQ